MGTQYEVWCEEEKEYVTATTIGWDSKRRINTTGRFAGIIYYLISGRWNGSRIKVISLEHWEYDDREDFYKENRDITKEVYKELCKEFPEDF
jgi:hypothetical protein